MSDCKSIASKLCRRMLPDLQFSEKCHSTGTNSSLEVAFQLMQMNTKSHGRHINPLFLLKDI
jgi:hypothetical protein